MRDERAEALAVLAEALRTPLSRVRLGAQRIGRTDLPPLCTDLLAELDGAVTDLDRRIERLCEALRPRPADEVADCGRVLNETLSRLSPMLAARGTPCTAPPDLGLLPGDARRVRRTTIELLRGAGRLQTRGELEVRLLIDAERACGVAISLDGAAPIPFERAQCVREELLAFGAVEDARLESSGDDPSPRFSAALSWDGAQPRLETRGLA